MACMGSHMSESSGKQLSLPNVGKVLDALGLGAGITALIDPSGVSAIAAATTPVARAVITHLDDNKQSKREGHLRLLLDNLRRRVERIEQRDEPPIDLFREMLLKAIEEEDERKIPLQGVIIEWVASTRPDPALARIAMTAVSELSFVELQSFMSWCRYDGRLRVPHGWHENQVWVRLHHYGLISQTGVISRGNITLIGGLFAERCPELVLDERAWERMN